MAIGGTFLFFNQVESQPFLHLLCSKDYMDRTAQFRSVTFGNTHTAVHFKA